VLIVKNAISAFLIMVAVATTSLAPNAPAENQRTPQHADKRIRVSERVLNGIAFKKVLPQQLGAAARVTRGEWLPSAFWLTTMGQ